MRIDTGDTTWILISTALVMLMTPGLSLFYGGMVRQKNVLGTIMQSFVALGLVTVQLLSVFVAIAYAFSITWIILKVLDRLMGLRVPQEEEVEELDLSQHGESRYIF